MEIIDNFADLKNFVNNRTNTNISFNYKQTNCLHQGHADLFTAASAAGTELIMASFWPSFHLQQKMWREFDDQSQLVDIPITWDQSYCEQFCIDNGVDIMFIPTNWFDELFMGRDLSILSSQANLILDNNNITFVSNQRRYIKSWLLVNYLIHQNQTSFWSRTKDVRSIKDGKLALYQKKLGDLYFPWEIILIPISRRPDGLPYSSKLDILNQDEINILIDIQNHFTELFNGVYTAQEIKDYLDAVSLRINRFDRFTVQHNANFYDFLELEIYIERIETSYFFCDYRRS